jgi:hypothetical protein
MANFRGIEFVEHVPGSPIENLETNSTRVTRMLDCAWDESLTFADKLLGYPTVMTGTGGVKYISRLTPAHHPDFLDPKGNPFVFVTRIPKLEGLGFRDKTADDTSQYEKARLTVVYETLTYEVLEDSEVHTAGVPDESRLLRFVTVRVKPYAEFLTLPRGALKWVATGQPSVNFGLPLLVPTFQVDITWHLVPLSNIPFINISDALGTINDAAFVTPLGSFPAGTLLMLVPDINPVRSALGDRLYDIEYHLKYKAPIAGGGGDHNYFLRPTGDAPPNDLVWTQVTRDGLSGGTKLYRSTDFKKLFKPV